MRTFSSGATRDSDDGKIDYEGFLNPAVLRRFGQYMHKHRKQADGGLRDSDNWQLGLPADACMKSLLRHVIDVWTIHRGYPSSTGEDIEEELCAVLFNSMAILLDILRKKNDPACEFEVEIDANHPLFHWFVEQEEKGKEHAP